MAAARRMGVAATLGFLLSLLPLLAAFAQESPTPQAPAAEQGAAPAPPAGQPPAPAGPQAGKRPAAAARPGPCHEDVQRLCSDARGAGGGVGRCLNEHMDDLSPSCRDFMQQHRAQMQQRGGAMHPGGGPMMQHGGGQAAQGGGRVGAQMHAACNEDRTRLCADAKPGGGGVMACLRAHESELSDDCRSLLSGRGASQ